MAKKKPKHFLLDFLLSIVDFLCEGIGNLFVGLVKAIFRGIGLLLKGIWKLIGIILWVILQPFLWLGRKLTGKSNRAEKCLKLTGEEFEDYAAQVLADNGFKHVEVTQYSGDQGVDILAERNGKRYAIQCKNYSGLAGNAAVQEAYAGMKYYECDRAVVLCTGGFTRAARELAESTGVLLWDGKKLSHMMQISGRRPKHRKDA